MKRLSLLYVVLFFISCLPLVGCTNVKPQAESGAMRIWLSPSYRSSSNVNPDGHLYVKVTPY